MTNKRHPITVRELMEELRKHDPDAEVFFGGLDYYRVKSRGSKIIQIEFNQSVYLDRAGLVVVDNHYTGDEPDVR